MNITEESYNKLLAENLALKEIVGQYILHSTRDPSAREVYYITVGNWNRVMELYRKIPETNYHEVRIRNAEYILGALKTYKDIANSLVKTLEELDTNV